MAKRKVEEFHQTYRKVKTADFEKGNTWIVPANNHNHAWLYVVGADKEEVWCADVDSHTFNLPIDEVLKEWEYVI